MDDDSSSKFIGSLTKFLQSLCNGYVEFQRGVELCGHIYLSIDTGEKVDYILHEKVSKNDENSVTFVSNSFHAQPLKEKEKEKSADKDASSKSAPSSRVSKDISGDDDDIMIVDQPKDVLGSTNSGTIPSKGVKRAGSPSSDHRQPQRIRSAAGSSLPRSQGSNSDTVVSPPRSVGSRPQPGGPSATVTSQDAAQDNLNMVDLKLEQITRDELLSLASQVGEGGSGPSHPTSSAPRPHPQPQRSGATASVNNTGDAALWIKQEVPEDNGTGDSDEVWSHGREDSNSNSGSNLYPVMLHQNPAAFSNPVFPGFSGSTTSGASSAANPYTNPLPGTSQDMSGLDPSVWFEATKRAIQQAAFSAAAASSGIPGSLPAIASISRRRQQQHGPDSSSHRTPSSTLSMRRYRQRLQENPELRTQYRARQVANQRRYMARKRQERSARMVLQSAHRSGTHSLQQPPFMTDVLDSLDSQLPQ